MPVRITQAETDAGQQATASAARLTQAAVDAGQQATASNVRLTQIEVDVALVEKAGFPWLGFGPWITAPVKRITG